MRCLLSGLIFGSATARLITIYDCRVEAEWTGTTSTGTEVKGQLVIPEVSHEMSDGISDYEVCLCRWTPPHCKFKG